VVYTSGIYKHFEDTGRPELAWIILSIHMLVGIAAILLFTKYAGLFKEQEK
jgi:hypothetical protein